MVDLNIVEPDVLQVNHLPGIQRPVEWETNRIAGQAVVPATDWRHLVLGTSLDCVWCVVLRDVNHQYEGHAANGTWGEWINQYYEIDFIVMNIDNYSLENALLTCDSAIKYFRLEIITKLLV